MVKVDLKTGIHIIKLVRWVVQPIIRDNHTQWGNTTGFSQLSDTLFVFKNI